MYSLITRGLSVVKNALVTRGLSLARKPEPTAHGTSNGVFDPATRRYLLGQTRKGSLTIGCVGSKRFKRVISFNLAGLRKYIQTLPFSASGSVKHPKCSFDVGIKGALKVPELSLDVGVKGVLKVPAFWSMCLTGQRRIAENKIKLAFKGKKRIEESTELAMVGARKISDSVEVEVKGKRNIAVLLEALDLL